MVVTVLVRAASVGGWFPVLVLERPDGTVEAPPAWESLSLLTPQWREVTSAVRARLAACDLRPGILLAQTHSTGDYTLDEFGGIGVEYPSDSYRSEDHFTSRRSSPDEVFALAEQAHTASAVRLNFWHLKGAWWVQDGFYAAAPGLTPEDIFALAVEHKRKRAAKLARARAGLTGEPHDRPARPAIPDDVKIFVWQRDEGRCTRCGRSEDLEFDHIIPRSMGGSDSARNLQLLCAPCNQAKGGNLV